MNRTRSIVVGLIGFLICFHPAPAQIDSLAYLADSVMEIKENRLPKTAYAISHGRELFQRHCNACHMISHELIGPALASISNKRPLPWLVRFIHNSQEVIRQGDVYAGGLFGRYNEIVMPPFEFLSQNDIYDILSYINKASTADFPVAGASPNNEIGRGEEPPPVEALTTGDNLSLEVRETSLQVGGTNLVFLVAMATITIISLVIFAIISVKMFKNLS
ncbi:MAG: c-type cytochrome [Candidatus Cyclobacteriaceae bacterium M3_2C_046]